MKTSLHKNVHTTTVMRTETVASHGSVRALPLRHGITEQIFYKWKKHGCVEGRTVHRLQIRREMVVRYLRGHKLGNRGTQKFIESTYLHKAFRSSVPDYRLFTSVV